MKDALIYLLEKYNALLIEELEETVVIAHNHHWKSTRVEQGKEIRDRIKKLKAGIVDTNKERV